METKTRTTERTEQRTISARTISDFIQSHLAGERWQFPVNSCEGYCGEITRGFVLSPIRVWKKKSDKAYFLKTPLPYSDGKVRMTELTITDETSLDGAKEARNRFKIYADGNLVAISEGEAAMTRFGGRLFGYN